MKKALITGITGQDGSYLAELLLNKGYEVHGIVRPWSVGRNRPVSRRVKEPGFYDDFILHPSHLTSFPGLYHILSRYEFDECYHLAAQSFVAENLEDGLHTMSENITSTHYLLAALRELQPGCRFYFAGSSEMFGEVTTSPQNEDTPMNPRNPYGISKLASYHLVRNYRNSHGIFASTGILFNHESPRRGEEFVTRKITQAAVRIKLGIQKKLFLGNLEAQRDWGAASDYVEAMHQIMTTEEADDFVVSTGELHSVRDFCELAFSYLGLNYLDYVEVDQQYFRPSEKVQLVGDSNKIQKKLGWKPKLNLPDIVAEMIESDLAIEKDEQK